MRDTMHILNIVTDDERPDTIRKPIIPELDLDDWEELVDLRSIEASDFSKQIALAAVGNDIAKEKVQSNDKRRAGRLLAEGRFKKLAEDLKEETGYSYGYGDVFAYTPKPKAAYDLWRRVITMYLDMPENLDIGPTAMVARLNKSDNGYTATRDMFYDSLNRFAKNDLARLLQTFGVALQLRGPVSIHSVRKALIERREAAAGLTVEQFTGRFVIRGNAVTVNGVEYKIQLGKSGKPRIMHRGEWLPINVLKSICSAT